MKIDKMKKKNLRNNGQSDDSLFSVTELQRRRVEEMSEQLTNDF